jgi:hypothetical protein
MRLRHRLGGPPAVHAGRLLGGRVVAADLSDILVALPAILRPIGRTRAAEKEPACLDRWAFSLIGIAEMYPV